jgi:3-methylcrotonyl-CoA carboxylase alpha subunit
MLRYAAFPVAKNSRWVLASSNKKIRVASILSLRDFSDSSTCRPVEKVLIANRGEIACRVIRTCRQLGIPTVAIYSVADGPNALHARMADEAYLIGNGPHPSESYLLQDQVIEIAKRSNSHAIHPGYGFLSENAHFCETVSQDPDLVFVGPPPKAITAMGSKSQSKAIMEEAGVPTTPGYYGDDTQDPEFLLQRAREIGFPLMIKAIMGGGGKGMRIVNGGEGEFLEKLQACQREALNSFGDDRVLLEKYLVNPRHVEVQVVCDQHGNAVHLFERDCSLQRRHQKIIEEAPASDLPMDLRERLGEMGTKAAQAVGYVSAGTVEFLLDDDDESFYFCEMNTRLQVEHPITELITDVDLVEWQLRIAGGEPLPKTQSEIFCNGHALEARIYAENPQRNFLPATGTVWHHEPPAVSNTGLNAKGVRVDTGIQSGQDVGVYYDPMICKLIVHDDTRQGALKKLVRSLKDYQIAGVPTNIDFLIQCAQHETFQKAGAINTGFLDHHLEEVLPKDPNEMPLASLSKAVGVFASLLHLEGRVGVSDMDDERRNRSPWTSLSGSWRMGGNAQRTFKLDDGTQVATTSHRDGSYDIQVGEDGEVFHVQGSLSSNRKMEVVVNQTHRMTVTTAMKESQGIFQIRMWPQQSGEEYFWEVNVENPLAPVSLLGAHHQVAGEGAVKAPMPGRISRIRFAVGDTVQQGDVLLVMEAMKMEHTIEAPVDGIVTDLPVKVGDVVQDDTLLVMVTSLESDDEEPEVV